MGVIKLQYFNPIVDAFGYTHSIDMIYVEYLIKGSWKILLEVVRGIHDKYPDLSYGEYLDRKPCSKFDFYLDAIAIGGAYVQLGKYNNYDAKTKTFDLIDMCQLRVNPNKHMHEDWFKELLEKVLFYNGGAYIRKYDYAIDLEVIQKDVQIFDTRKEKGLYKGTQYYGQSGRHGYVKIYNKAKELKKLGIECPDVLTRVEYTLMSGMIPSLDKVSICVDDTLASSVTLKDTDRAIIDMYRLLKEHGITYELNLGRGKSEKLRPFLQGEFRTLEYDDYLDKLLSKMREIFCAYLDELPVLSSSLPTDEDGYVDCDGMEMPFD